MDIARRLNCVVRERKQEVLLRVFAELKKPVKDGDMDHFTVLERSSFEHREHMCSRCRIFMKSVVVKPCTLSTRALSSLFRWRYAQVRSFLEYQGVDTRETNLVCKRASSLR